LTLVALGGVQRADVFLNIRTLPANMHQHNGFEVVIKTQKYILFFKEMSSKKAFQYGYL